MVGSDRPAHALRVVEVVSGSPASSSGLNPGDLILAVGGVPLGDAQSLQRLLFEDSIGARLEITVLRNGALVDAVAVPCRAHRLSLVGVILA